MNSVTRRRLVADTWTVNPGPDGTLDENVLSETGSTLEANIEVLTDEEKAKCEMGVEDCQLNAAVDREKEDLGAETVTIDTQCILAAHGHCVTRATALAENIASVVEVSIGDTSEPHSD